MLFLVDAIWHIITGRGKYFRPTVSFGILTVSLGMYSFQCSPSKRSVILLSKWNFIIYEPNASSVMLLCTHNSWPSLHFYNTYIVCVHNQIARLMRPAWGPPGSCRPQMGPMFAQWTLLSEYIFMHMYICIIQSFHIYHFYFNELEIWNYAI